MSSTATPPPNPTPGSSSGQVAAAIGGGLLALIAAALLFGGVFLALAYAFVRDDDGYFTSPTERLQTATPAITGEGLDLGDVHGTAGDWLADILDVSARITVTGADGEPLFVGVARQSEVDAYLDGVAHDEVTDVHDGDVTYRRSAGVDRAAPPAGEGFWAASTQGRGRQTLTWELEEGRWAAVLMRADGEPGVIADVSVGGRTEAVLWVALILVLLGVVVAVPAGLMIWVGVRGPRAPRSASSA